MDPKTRVDIALNWFVHKKTPANLVMLYVEEPDTQSHIWGPDAKIVRSKRRQKYLISHDT